MAFPHSPVTKPLNPKSLSEPLLVCFVVVVVHVLSGYPVAGAAPGGAGKQAVTFLVSTPYFCLSCLETASTRLFQPARVVFVGESRGGENDGQSFHGGSPSVMVYLPGTEVPGGYRQTLAVTFPLIPRSRVINPAVCRVLYFASHPAPGQSGKNLPVQ